MNSQIYVLYKRIYEYFKRFHTFIMYEYNTMKEDIFLYSI